MFSKIPLVPLIMLGFMFSWMVGECFADVSTELEQSKSNVISLIIDGNFIEAKMKTQKLIADFPNDQSVPDKLYEIADRFAHESKFEEEKYIYQQIIQNYPDIPHSNKARLGVATTEIQSLIVSKKNEKAEKAIDKLVKDFSKHQDLPKALYWIGERYRWTHEHEKAKNVYKQVTDNYSESSYASRAQLAFLRAEAVSFIVSKDYDQAQKVTNKMIADFSGHPDLPEELYWIARRYGWADEYEEEMAICQQIIQNYPDHSYADKARLGFSRANIASLIESGNYGGAEEAIDNLITDFAGNPDLPKSVLESADRYYIKALRLENEGSYGQAKDLYRRALTIHGIMENRFPDCLVIADPLLIKGVCHRGVGEYEKSIESLQTIVDKWPEYEYAWNALSLIGSNYEDLKRLKAISETDADAKIMAAYKKLLRDYPDCSAAQSAQNWLDRHNSKR